MVTDASDGTDQPGEWCSVSEAARRLGLSRRGVRDRLERGRLTARATNRGTREVFVPSSMVAPLEGPQAATGRPVGVTRTMVGPSVLAPDALEKERERREGLDRELAAVRIELAEARGTLAAKAETIDTLRAERDRLLAEVAELRRGWIARVVGQVRDALRR